MILAVQLLATVMLLWLLPTMVTQQLRSVIHNIRYNINHWDLVAVISAIILYLYGLPTIN